jgi:hypothetical protein
MVARRDGRGSPPSHGCRRAVSFPVDEKRDVTMAQRALEGRRYGQRRPKRHVTHQPRGACRHEQHGARSMSRFVSDVYV